MAPKEPLLGHIDNISELFSDFKLCQQIVTEKGSHISHPEGYYFIGGRYLLRSYIPSMHFRNNKTYFLYGRPTEILIEAISKYCPYNSIGSFEIIDWTDRILIKANDNKFIGSVWLAFMPLGHVLDIATLELYPTVK